MNAPASRTFEHCKVWVECGCKVTVVTGAPNFPFGKIYKGYKNRLWQKEKIHGIEVIRVWTFVTKNDGFFKRILDFASFMITSFVAGLFVKKIDIIVGTSPQLLTVLSTYFISVFKKKPWVFELRDLWPESIKTVGLLRNSLIFILLEKLELFLYKKSTAIIPVTNSFKKDLIQRGISPKKLFVVTNGVDNERYFWRPKSELILSRHQIKKQTVIGYIGTHGVAHKLDTLIEAAKLLQNSGFSQEYKMIFVGDGADKNRLKKLSSKMKLRNVIFVDTVPKEEIVNYWSILDLTIIHLKNSLLFKTVIPSKIFEAMGMGVPIVHGVKGESSEIIKNRNVGLLFQPEDPMDLFNKIIYLTENTDLREKFSINGINASKNFYRRNLAIKMLNILKKHAQLSSPN